MQFSSRNQLRDPIIKSFRPGAQVYINFKIAIEILYNNTLYCYCISNCSKTECEKRAKRLVMLLNEDEWRKSEAAKKTIGHP